MYALDPSRRDSTAVCRCRHSCSSDGAQTTIDELHRKGKWVSCYISVGTVESWRSDAGAFPSEAVGNSWEDWAGEKFLDISQQVPLATYLPHIPWFLEKAFWM